MKISPASRTVSALYISAIAPVWHYSDFSRIRKERKQRKNSQHHLKRIEISLPTAVGELINRPHSRSNFHQLVWGSLVGIPFRGLFWTSVRFLPHGFFWGPLESSRGPYNYGWKTLVVHIKWKVAAGCIISVRIFQLSNGSGSENSPPTRNGDDYVICAANGRVLTG